MKNAPDEMKKQLLDNAKVVAVVGLSDNPTRASYRVASYLKSQGYKIVPVNPGLYEVLGEKAYPDLRSIPFKIDLVDVFRRSEEVPEIVKTVQELGIPAIWLQQGIECDDTSTRLATDNNITLVEDCCMMVEHKQLNR